jgi:hypothetical protein
MPTNPLDTSFWLEERKAMWSTFNDMLMDAMLEGASNGLPLLPAALRPLVNWDTVNESALSFLKKYQSEILDTIEMTTEKQARTIVADWARSGSPLETLRQELAPIFGSRRAATIAATEVTRMFAAGNQMLWESTGVVEAKVWQTARDEMVCPLCGPLHNKVVSIDREFLTTPTQLANSRQMKAILGSGYNQESAMKKANQLLKGQGISVPYPPRHPNCRCWIKPVVSLERVEDRIGNILAQQFFAEVRAGKYPQVAYARPI